MTSIELGESLVGAYLRDVVGCEVAPSNPSSPTAGELDLVGVKARQPRIA
jgi:hypothetical protein